VRKGRVAGRGLGIFRWQIKKFPSVGVFRVGILYFLVRVYKIWRGEEECVHDLLWKKVMEWRCDVVALKMHGKSVDDDVVGCECVHVRSEGQITCRIEQCERAVSA
jgi:hypothetical protein